MLGDARLPSCWALPRLLNKTGVCLPPYYLLIIIGCREIWIIKWLKMRKCTTE